MNAARKNRNHRNKAPKSGPVRRRSRARRQATPAIAPPQPSIPVPAVHLTVMTLGNSLAWEARHIALSETSLPRDCITEAPTESAELVPAWDPSVPLELTSRSETLLPDWFITAYGDLPQAMAMLG